MCMGGGGQQATIYKPDYGAYDDDFGMQMQAMQTSMNNGNTQLQQTLNDTYRRTNDLKEQIADIKAAEAEDADELQEEARRLSVLAGTPAPEAVAQAPVIGDRNREPGKKRGKSALRIGRKVASGSSQGSGFNIT
jgi:hypothetical protein